MKVAIAGSIIHDEIIPLEGEPTDSFGGILYNVVAFAEAFGQDATIVPICHVGTDDISELRARYLDDYPQIHLDGILPHPGGSNQNILKYLS